MYYESQNWGAQVCKSLYCLWNQPCENFAVHFATVETESLEKSTLGKKGLLLKSSTEKLGNMYMVI